MKKQVLSILTIALAVVGSAFTLKVQPTATFQCEWYIYEGAPTSGYDNFANYRPLQPGESVETLCADTEDLCAVCIDVSTDLNPMTGNFTSAFQSEISTAVAGPHTPDDTFRWKE